MTYFPRVFVSSSSDPNDEIKTYRDTVREAVLDAQMTPIMFEHYRKRYTDGKPLKLSSEMIDASDIFIGFYSAQYGSPVIDDRDWAEYEYDYAKSHNKDMIIFFPNRQHLWHNLADAGLKRFKKKVESHLLFQGFTSMENLKTQVTSLLLEGFQKLSQTYLRAEPIFRQPVSHSQYNADIFMIMPFREDLIPLYKQVKATVEGNGLSIKRGDDFFSTDSIMADIWAATYQSKAVIADCTGKNANVFYELGIAHTLGRKFILLTQDEKDIPFDLRHYRYILYSPDHLEALDDELKNALDNLNLKNSD